MKLRVVSYNIHKCIGGVDRRYDPARTVACLAHYAPDVVLLQEVDAGAKRSNEWRKANRSVSSSSTTCAGSRSVRIGSGNQGPT